MIIILLLGIGAVLVYAKTFLPNVGPAPDITIEITPKRLDRGRYLANHVALCIDCHSIRDWNKFGAPPKKDMLGAGGEVFKREWGFPGIYWARNITPYGVGTWTDGELFRAITTGVSKDGSALFPIMPYHTYGQMEKEDVYSIIAYIRTLKPISHDLPESVSDFPFNFIINTIPKKADFSRKVDKTDKVAYGEYLSIGCIECHTPAEKGQIIPELSFSGGREFSLPSKGIVRSSNITFDKKTGLGNWTKKMFIDKFMHYGDSSYTAEYVAENEFNTVMPWSMYSGLTESDLSAIYSYLKTVNILENEVVKFTPE